MVCLCPLKNVIAVLTTAMLLPLAACSPTEPLLGDGALLVQTGAADYAAGDSVQLTLRNIGPVSLGYMPCPLLLDRREGIRWIEHGAPLLSVCDLIVLGLEPGEVRSQPVRLPDALPTGTYRFRFESLAPADRFFEAKLPLEFRVSNPFVVR